MPDARATIAALSKAGLTVATAESLTGGLLSARLTDVPGASSVVRGGVVAYATESKRDVLGVASTTLDEHGAVSAQTAREMASRVRELFHSDIGIATTGVAGPDTQEGKPVGTVFIAVATPRSVEAHQYVFAGSREQIREQSVEAAVGLLAATTTD